MMHMIGGGSAADEPLGTNSIVASRALEGRPGLRDECRTWQELTSARRAIVRERVLGVLVRSVPVGGVTAEFAWSCIAGLYVVDFVLSLVTAFLVPVLVAVLRLPFSR